MSFLRFIEIAHQVVHGIKLIGEIAEHNNKPNDEKPSNPAPVLSLEELKVFFTNSCEATNAHIPEMRTPQLLFQGMSITPDNERALTYRYKYLAVDRDNADVASILEQRRQTEVKQYRADNGFENTARSNNVSKIFVLEDMHGRFLGVTTINPTELTAAGTH